MKKKIQIVEKDDSIIVKMTKENLVSELQNNPYHVLSNYELDDDFIIEYRNYIPKELMFEINLSENVVKSLLERDYFEISDISSFSMGTYAGFSSEFISKVKEHLNWNRYILWLSANDNFNIDEYIYHFIDNNDPLIWNIISVNDLPIEFLRKFKKNINWTMYFATNNPSDEIIQEFGDLKPIKEKSIAEEKSEYIDNLVFNHSDVMNKIIESINNL
jgi:hypothetical protein